MKGEGDCSKQHFLPSIFEMSTSLRPTVKFSDSEKGPYLIIITSRQVFKNLWKKVVFLSLLYRLTSPPASARAQTPVVMISVTESGNYWTFLFMPRARSKLTHPHTPTCLLSPFSFLPLPPSRHLARIWAEQTALVPSGKSRRQNPHEPPGLVLQKSEVGPESRVSSREPGLHIPASKLDRPQGGLTQQHILLMEVCLQTMVRLIHTGTWWSWLIVDFISAETVIYGKPLSWGEL